MWVVNAVYHKVRELDIVYESYDIRLSQTYLPSNLYTCESLVILKLEGDTSMMKLFNGFYLVAQFWKI